MMGRFYHRSSCADGAGLTDAPRNGLHATWGHDFEALQAGLAMKLLTLIVLLFVALILLAAALNAAAATL